LAKEEIELRDSELGKVKNELEVVTTSEPEIILPQEEEPVIEEEEKPVEQPEPESEEEKEIVSFSASKNRRRIINRQTT